MKHSLLAFLITSAPFVISCQTDPNPSNNDKTDYPKECSSYDPNISNQPDTCDNPDANISCCFTNMPQQLNNVMTIASDSEPGIQIIIKGRILNADTKEPYRCMLMYAYHTDNDGYYSKAGDETGVQKWHGRLHGWCKTDTAGNYEIHSIRPAQYPTHTIPAHIHAALKLHNGLTFYINDFVFSDDALVTADYLDALNNPMNPAGDDNGVITLTLVDGIMSGERDILIKE